jgi:hypothetical protein
VVLVLLVLLVLLLLLLLLLLVPLVLLHAPTIKKLWGRGARQEQGCRRP